MSNFLLGVAVSVIAFGCVFWLWLKFKPTRSQPVQVQRVHSHIEQFRAIGRLAVYRVRIQEIVTETDHSWGEFGRKYLSWFLSSKKMAMVFEFDIDFVYNLQDSRFEIKEAGGSQWRILMPPCEHELRIRNIRFYDEQGSKLLPSLLPSLVNGFLGIGFSEEDKNRLLDAARRHAGNQALELIKNTQSDVHKSASSTLGSISRAFGADNVDFTFSAQLPTEVDVAIPDTVTPS